MKNESAYTRKFNALLRKLQRHYEAEPPEPLEPITQIVRGFLQWESTRRAAELAHERLMRVLVDNNDLRVSHHQEVLGLIGPRYPRVEERVARMHDALQEIFVREHGVTLRAMESKSKKEVRAYLDSLPGMIPYVAAQAMLLAYGAHAVPVDETLAKLLIQEGATDPHATPDQIAAFIERCVKAGNALRAHVALQAWVDAGSRRISAARPPRKKPARKSRRKTAARKRPTKKKSTRKPAARKKKK